MYILALAMFIFLPILIGVALGYGVAQLVWAYASKRQDR